MISLKIFFNGKHFTSKQTEQKTQNNHFKALVLFMGKFHLPSLIFDHFNNHILKL
jgi:hypothetical protein